MFVTSTGMACPVGLTSAAACAAMRAGISIFEELPYRDNQGEPVIGAPVPEVGPELDRDQRLVEILALALKDCLKDHPSLRTPHVPLLVCLAEENRPGGAASFASSIQAAIETKIGSKFHREQSRTIATGHAAGFEALRLARKLLQASDIPACLVCGVDSYINARSLLWLDQHWRLKTPASEHGLIPGEAAAAVLVQRTPSAESALEIVGLGFGQEKAHVLSEEPLLGLGLTAAARAALAEAGLGFHEMDWRVSDVTGEQYGFKELPLVEGRLVRKVRKIPQPIWHSADSTGDTGAAAGIVQLVMVDQAFRKQYAPGDRAICFCSSVNGERAAAVLQRRAT